MTLSTKLIDAGWHEVEAAGGLFAAEKTHSLPGATASTIRVEAASRKLLNDAVKLRESQLAGSDQPILDTITNDGTLVTGPQHESLRTEGVTVSGAKQVTEPVPNEDEAKQEALFDATEGSVNAPQVPSDAADQGMSPKAADVDDSGKE